MNAQGSTGACLEIKTQRMPPPPSEATLFADSLLAAPEAAAGFVLESALPAAAEFACSHGIGFNA